MKAFPVWLITSALLVVPATGARAQESTPTPAPSVGGTQAATPSSELQPEPPASSSPPSPEVAPSTSAPAVTREPSVAPSAVATPQPPRGNPSGNDHQRVAAAETHSNPETLSRLANDGNDYVRLAVANNPNATTEQLQRLAQDGNYWVAKAALESLQRQQQAPVQPQPQPAATASAPASSPSPVPPAAPSRGPTPSATAAVRPAGNPTGNDRQRVMAAETYSNTKVLTSLAKDGNDYVRLAVAGNPNTSVADLNKLAQDGNVFVAAAAQATLSNLQTPNTVATVQPQREPSPLASPPSAIVGRPSPSPSTSRTPSSASLPVPARSPSPSSAPTSETSARPTIDPARLGSDRQRVELAEGNASTQVLTVLAQDGNDYVRLAVAENEKTSVSDLQRLTQDGNSYVAAAAKETLAQVLSAKSPTVERVVPSQGTQAPSALSAVAAQTLVRPELERAQVASTSLNSSLLAELASDSSELVRLNAAGNAATPVAQLLELVRDENAVVAMAAQATLIGTSKELSSGASSANPEVLTVIQPIPAIKTGNPNGSDAQRVDAAKTWTSAETLEVLSTDRNDFVRLAVAANSKTSTQTLEAMLEDSNVFVAETASIALSNRAEESGTGTSPEAQVAARSVPEFVMLVPLVGAIFSWLQPGTLADGSSEERLEQAQPSTSVDDLNRMAMDPDTAVRRAVVDNPQASLSALVALSVDADPQISSAALSRLAGDAPLPAEVESSGPVEAVVSFLAGIFGSDQDAQDADTTSTAPPVFDLPSQARVGLAASLSASPGAQALIAALAEDDDADVRSAIAKNPFTPTPLLKDLATDSSPEIAHLAAWRAFLNTYPDAEMVLDSRSVLAAPIGGIFEGIPELMQDRVTLGNTTHVGSAVLAQLSLDSEPAVRQAVAGNPHTSIETLHRLVADKDAEVALAAHQSLANRTATDASARDWLVRASGYMDDYATANPWKASLDEHAARVVDKRNQLASWGTLVARTHNAVEMLRLERTEESTGGTAALALDLIGNVNGGSIRQERNLPGNIKDPNDNRLKTRGDLSPPELQQARGSRVSDPYLTTESLTPNLCRINGGAIQGNGFGSCVLESTMSHPLTGQTLGTFLSTVQVGAPTSAVSFTMVDYIESLKSLQPNRREWSTGASAKPSVELWTEEDVSDVLNQANLSQRCFNLIPKENQCLVENASLADAATAALARSELQRIHQDALLEPDDFTALSDYVVALDRMNLVGDDMRDHVSAWKKPASSWTQRVTIDLPKPPEGLSVSTQVVGGQQGCRVQGTSIETSIAPNSRQSNTCLVRVTISGEALAGESMSVLKVVRPGVAYA